MFDHYQDKLENTSWLKITNGTSFAMKVVYSVPISALAGDKIIASYCTEVTNEQTWTFQTGSYVVLGDTETDTTQSKSILRAKGENVTPAMHHQIVQGTCMHSFSEDFTGYINVCMYAISTSAGSGSTATIEQGYGQLDVAHFKVNR